MRYGRDKRLRRCKVAGGNLSRYGLDPYDAEGGSTPGMDGVAININLN